LIRSKRTPGDALILSPCLFSDGTPVIGARVPVLRCRDLTGLRVKVHRPNVAAWGQSTFGRQACLHRLWLPSSGSLFLFRIITRTAQRTVGKRVLPFSGAPCCLSLLSSSSTWSGGERTSHACGPIQTTNQQGTVPEPLLSRQVTGLDPTFERPNALLRGSSGDGARSAGESAWCISGVSTYRSRRTAGHTSIDST
jgi:hypothetical protein